MKKRQQGIALITILMMVALASIIAATIAQRQQNTNESTAYLLRQHQSLNYAKSAESFFSELLVQDAKSGSKSDHLQETWAQPMPAFPIDGGYVAGRIVDETGKFNLNTLVKEDGTPNPNAQAFFQALLKRVGLSAELVEAVIDWQDQDDLVIGAMGAESAYYGSLPKPYLPSNRSFQSVEELKQVRGFEGQNYELIRPYVTAIPSKTSKININTAPTLLIATINENLNVDNLDNELKQKQQSMEGFESVDQLWQLQSLSNLSNEQKQLAQSNFDVKSMFYQVNIEVMIADRKRQFSSYLYRKDEQVFVFSRSMAPVQL